MAGKGLSVAPDKVRAGDRAALARAITLIESTRADHRADAGRLLSALMRATGHSVRLGITGPPGVGKSTLIDALGMALIAQGRRVAVLAIDPSSTKTGGAILGDKTRMAKLSTAREAFVRPSPSAGTLGGVHARTRETMLLAEAAGYDVVIVETVGVGQSETAVASMVDTFLALSLPGSGDELQGIKKGVLETADIIAVNKADGEAANLAKKAAADLLSAVKILAPHAPPRVLTLSGATGAGLSALWAAVMDHRAAQEQSGAFAARRRAQNVSWMRDMVHDGLVAHLSARAGDMTAGVEAAVAAGELSPTDGAQRILARLERRPIRLDQPDRAKGARR
ncbi:MAG: methylmalonyl Co-A mutase-associated GTPase MeaB [Pseudomonadota bacterium]